MKIIKGLAIFFLFTILFGSCFEPPQFPVVPEIEFDKIEFVDAETDSLIIYLNFKDGDGDLGLDPTDFNYISYPFNNSFYFQEHNGKVDTLATVAVPSPTTQYDILLIPDPNTGKLVFPRTRKNPLYSFLPAYNCLDYEFLLDRKLLIRKEDLKVLDKTVRIVDTLYSPTTTYYQIQDTLMTRINPNHYNIEVDFLVKTSQDQFTEFDFRKEFCTQSYDGRFPVLSTKNGALDGTLRYSMIGIGFINIFSVKVLKLRIQIKDRALHRSNVLETPEFTLDRIRK